MPNGQGLPNTNSTNQHSQSSNNEETQRLLQAAIEMQNSLVAAAMNNIPTSTANAQQNFDGQQTHIPSNTSDGVAIAAARQSLLDLLNFVQFSNTNQAPFVSTGPQAPEPPRNLHLLSPGVDPNTVRAPRYHGLPVPVQAAQQGLAVSTGAVVQNPPAWLNMFSSPASSTTRADPVFNQVPSSNQLLTMGFPQEAHPFVLPILAALQQNSQVTATTNESSLANPSQQQRYMVSAPFERQSMDSLSTSSHTSPSLDARFGRPTLASSSAADHPLISTSLQQQLSNLGVARENYSIVLQALLAIYNRQDERRIHPFQAETTVESTLPAISHPVNNAVTISGIPPQPSVSAAPTPNTIMMNTYINQLLQLVSAPGVVGQNHAAFLQALLAAESNRLQQQTSAFPVASVVNQVNVSIPIITSQTNMDYISSAIPNQQQVSPATRSYASAAGASMPDQAMMDSVNSSPSAPLFLQSDTYSLSSFQCLVRKQIEYFVAGQEDVDSNAQGRNRRIVLGQIGIRCRHCTHVGPKQRSPGSVYYPRKLSGIYQVAQNMAHGHILETCRYIPQDIRNELVLSASRKTFTGSGKSYWADTASTMGIYEDGTCLRLR